MSAYKALNGIRFDWNMVALVGKRTLAFLDSANDPRGAPHTITAYTPGFVPDHYRLLHFLNKQTGGFLITDTYTLCQAYCKLPAITEGDRTVSVAKTLLEPFKMITPNGTKDKVSIAH